MKLRRRFLHLHQCYAFMWLFVVLFFYPIMEINSMESTFRYEELKQNIIDGKNVLQQEMLQKKDTRYIIKYNYILAEDIIIPPNCILEFEGGSLSGNYTLKGVNTMIKTPVIKIFDKDILLAGSWQIMEVYPEWFGAVGDNVTDDSNALQKAVVFGGLTKTKVVIQAKTYGIGSTIYLPSFVKIVGVDRHFSVLKAIKPVDVILQTALNATLITIDNIRLEGDNLALNGLRVGSNSGNVTAHCVFQNIRAKDCVENNLYFEYLELSQINNILSEGAKIGVSLNNPMTIYLRDIRVSDSKHANFQVINSTNLRVEYLYTFNEKVDGQVLCKLINVANSTFYHPHFEPQKDVACNLYITSDGSLSTTYSVNCSGLRIINPNFCGLNYAGDLIKLEVVDKTGSERYTPSISNVKVVNGECLIPKAGSFVINNIDCEDLILEDFIQKETGNYAAPALSPILANQINNPNGHNIKQINTFGGEKTLLSGLYPIKISSTDRYLMFPKTISAGTYYLCAQRKMTNTEVLVGKNLASMQRVGQSDDGYKNFYVPLKFDTDIPAGYFMKIVRYGFEKYYKDVAFVLSEKVVSVNGDEVPDIPDVGTSEERPMTKAVPVGFRFFDTQLGKPIFAKTINPNGTIIWVDSNGNVID